MRTLLSKDTLKRMALCIGFLSVLPTLPSVPADPIPAIVNGVANWRGVPAPFDDQRSALGCPQNGGEIRRAGMIGQEEAASLTDTPNIQSPAPNTWSDAQTRPDQVLHARVASILRSPPGLVGAEKAARGKTPTDVWWHTIVSPTGKEKTGYATQKPLGVLERIMRVHSNAGETVLDFFAGSGTTGEAAAKHGRRFLLVDESANAINVMNKRLARYLDQKSELERNGRFYRNFGTSPSDKQMTITPPDPDNISPARL